MKTIHVRRLSLALAGGLGLLAAGCTSTTNIAHLLAEPQRYAHHNVGLQGDVVEASPPSTAKGGTRNTKWRRPL